MPDDFAFEIAVDVGNSAAKFWLFDHRDHRDEPVEVSADKFARVAVDDLSGTNWLMGVVASLLFESTNDQAIRWWISSVNKSAATLLTDAIQANRPHDRYMILTNRDVPIAIDVDQPERVGTDRLLSAAAALQLKQEGRAAIVVDAGSAITCDYVSADGVFQGGAILPGFELQLKALSRDTAQLPLIDVSRDARPLTPIGKSTDAAIRSGVTIGILGAVREMIHRISESAPADPQLFFTGGDIDQLRSLAEDDSFCLPQLVALGIASTARHVLQSNANI